jgi:predicted RNA-binding protein Jag
MDARRHTMNSRQFRDAKVDWKGAAKDLSSFLDALLQHMKLDVAYDLEVSDNERVATPANSQAPDPASTGADDQVMLAVNFHGPDGELLAAQQGELLLAIEYLAVRCLHLSPPDFHRVQLDCGGFRALRLEELKLSARVAAQRVRETLVPFHFNPMPPRERRLMHLELNSAKDVRTLSEGEGPERHLVIHPAETHRPR